MANDMNACHFTGRLGDDPEVRHLPSGNMVANIRLAVGKQWRDKNSGEKQEATSWVRCVAFGKTAELAQQYLTKGAQIRVTCEMRENKWQDQQGQNRSSIDFNIRELQFLSGGKQQGAPGQCQQPPQGQGAQYPPQGQGQQGYQHPPQQPPQQGSNYGAPNQGAPNTGSFDDFDDEIPF